MRAPRVLLRAREHAETLAVFRVVVCAVVLVSGEVHSAFRAGALPPAARVPPRGLFQWIELPVSIALTKTAFAVVLLGCIAGLVGWRTRVALIAAAIALLYLLGVAQLTGNVVHDHHLVWFLALLAASPAGDALSVDARDRRERGEPEPPSPSIHYGIPVIAARALIAMVFLFPGIWKLRESGLAWIFSDNLRNQMWWKWFQYDWVPSLRIDRCPALCRGLALSAVAFELLFPFAIWSRRLRPFAVLAALLFHAAIQAFLAIPFISLWLCYVVFIDWGSTLRRPDRSSSDERAPIAALVVGGTLLLGNAIYGAMGWMNGWPFACYPTFQWMVGTTTPGLVIEGVRADGSAFNISGRARTQAEWGVQWSLLGLRGAPIDPARLRAHALSLPRAREAARLRFHRVVWSVDPDRRDAAPIHAELIAELAR